MLAVEGATRPSSGTRAELRSLLARAAPFSSLTDEVLGELVVASELVNVPGGTRLLRAGEALDALVAVVHGALRALRCGDGGVVREFYRGDALGVMGLLTPRAYPVDLYAVRDSTILRLSRTRFMELVDRYPSLLLAFAQTMSTRAFEIMDRLTGSASVKNPVLGNLALVPLTSDPTVGDATTELATAMRAQRHLTHVTAGMRDRALGETVSSEESGDATQLTAWMSDLESGADLVVYEGDSQRPRWTAGCVRQSDRVVLVAVANGPPPLDAIDRIVREVPREGLARPIDLVLVHPADSRVPIRTREWNTMRELHAIHHVRGGARADIARVARRLVGRPIGLVLSGGGARGIAHVGVVAALNDAGIPIDYVCGTSIGAIFAAGVALGLDGQQMREQVRELFGRLFPLYDLTVPTSSLLGGRKLSRVLRRQLGDGDIEDLWHPFFCVSTDLAAARLVVHDRGSLWRSVRASCSIPGIFPPIAQDGAMLVDGGLMDNLPLDLLAERCDGPLIAVDVGGGMRGHAVENAPTPRLFELLTQSTMVGSRWRQLAAMARSDQIVVLEPPVAAFGVLQWRAHRELFEAGYRYARGALEAHRAALEL